MFYGDSIVLAALAWNWCLKITVLNSKTLREMRIRHDAPLHMSDLCLVWNGKNHYVGARKYNCAQKGCIDCFISVSIVL